jgi:hypothetical protein
MRYEPRFLLTDKNQNARCQCQDSHYDYGDSDVQEQSDSDEYQVDGEKEHSEVLSNVHASLLTQDQRVCTP